MSPTQKSATNRLLGYPADARLLIVNADDFGMYQAINEATIRSMKEGIVQSTTLMMPCPGAPAAIALLRANPDLHFGVHLSVICDIDHFRWNPLSPKANVPSLLDETDNFYHKSRMAEMLEKTKIEELELEYRAQIEAVLATGLKPTHLDWHVIYNGGRADAFNLTYRLAKEYRLALRVMSQPYISQVLHQGLPADEYDVLDSFSLKLEHKSDQYAHLLRELPEGLSEWAVHPGLDTVETRTLDPDGLLVRQTDFDFVGSPLAREIIKKEGITLLNYAPLQDIWRARTP